jgi:AcrR family transcriptional regulator
LQELLLDPSVGTVSVPQVVQKAGVSQGTFYSYFDSLPAAVEAVGWLLIAEHMRVLQEVNAGAANQAELVTRTTRQTLALFATRPEFGRLLFDSGVSLDGLIVGFRIQLHGDVQRGVESGEFHVDDVDTVCSLFAGAVIGACMDMYRGRATLDSVPKILGQLLRLLNINADRVNQLIISPQKFVEWRPLPLSEIESD